MNSLSVSLIELNFLRGYRGQAMGIEKREAIIETSHIKMDVFYIRLAMAYSPTPLPVQYHQRLRT